MSNHKLVVLEGIDKARVVLADDLDAIVCNLTDPCFVGEKKFNFNLEILKCVGKGVNISWDSNLAREDMGDLGIGEGVGVPTQMQLDRICTVLTVVGICFTLAFICLIAEDRCSDCQNSELTWTWPSHPHETE